MAGLNEIIMNHPIVVYLTALIIGFVAGIGTYKGILEITNQETVIKGSYTPNSLLLGKVLKNEALNETRKLIEFGKIISAESKPNEAEAFLTRTSTFINNLDLPKIKHPNGDSKSVPAYEIDLICLGFHYGYKELNLTQKLARAIGILQGLESSFISSAEYLTNTQKND